MSPRSRIVTASFILLLGAFAAISVDDGRTNSAPPVAEYSALEPARFEISFHRGQLRLAGHTASSDHELQLLQAGQQLFPESVSDASFKPLGTAPGQWQPRTLAVLNALSTTRSSSAILTRDTLRVRGVGTNDWHGRFDRLRSILSDAVDLDVDMVVPTDEIAVADVCARAFAEYKPGPINFEESGTEFRSSAYQVLDRMISLADACRDSSIAITGYTDSSGPESWNRHLSLARAQSVADYMVERGIARARLQVTGAGSSLPVADNATRFGRSLNRRIDVTFRDRRHLEST
ncbi:MAG: OmpA family protein [Gammaproteobacteria bacterium]|nr:OmpA family protein [Gammaproteobacteria bacterium]MBU2676302.1 OmpA family protein [Gammaproteobacteria bacterium]NNC57965.1 OmpA family protein [Woeseiaceae bacterium]NNL50036.1 OmpA family protein [Woeseiaceae bacterium]